MCVKVTVYSVTASVVMKVEQMCLDHYSGAVCCNIWTELAIIIPGTQMQDTQH